MSPNESAVSFRSVVAPPDFPPNQAGSEGPVVPQHAPSKTKRGLMQEPRGCQMVEASLAV